MKKKQKKNEKKKKKKTDKKSRFAPRNPLRYLPSLFFFFLFFFFPSPSQVLCPHTIMASLSNGRSSNHQVFTKIF